LSQAHAEETGAFSLGAEDHQNDFLRFYFGVVLPGGEDHIREFMVTFIIFYLVNLVFESWFFLAFECNRKRKKENEKIA
jgi:hypothetical protein